MKRFVEGVDRGRIPRVIDHRARMRERPAVKTALAAETAG